MAVTIDDVRHIATLARLGLSDDRAALLMRELNTILVHMDALSQVDTTGVPEAVGSDAAGMPLREDGGMPVPLARSLDAFAPSLRDGFFFVPRLATHETPEEA